MNKTQKRLGRGLSSLISLPDAPADTEPLHARPGAGGVPGRIPIAQLRPNPFQPRSETDPAQLQSLAQSIREKGLIQPIVVRPAGEGVFEVVAGERRWRASQLAGLSEIPAVVRDASDSEMLELALVENIFREDLNAIDRALAYRRYCQEFNLTPEEVAARLDEDRSTVTNYLRLLDLPNEVKHWVAAGELAMGHARCLLAVKSASDLVRLARQVIDQGLSVRAVEKLVRERVEARNGASRPNGGRADGKRPQIRHLEEAFMRELGCKVEIAESRRKGRGKIIIHYASLDEFDALSERLGVDVNQQ